MTVSVGLGWLPAALTSQIHLHLFSLMLLHYKLNTFLPLFTQSLTLGIVKLFTIWSFTTPLAHNPLQTLQNKDEDDNNDKGDEDEDGKDACVTGKHGLPHSTCLLLSADALITPDNKYQTHAQKA